MMSGRRGAVGALDGAASLPAPVARDHDSIYGENTRPRTHITRHNHSHDMSENQRQADSHIGWPQIRVNVSAATYEALFRRAHMDGLAGTQHRTQHHASNIVDAALKKHLGLMTDKTVKDKGEVKYEAKDEILVGDRAEYEIIDKDGNTVRRRRDRQKSPE